MSELMGEPERQQLGIKAEPLSIRVCDGGEMLQARERNPLPIDYQLAGVRSSHADHEHDLHVDILLEKSAALLLGRSGERDHIGPLEHLLQIGAIGESRCPNDVAEVRPLGVDDVVLPVRLEETTMS